MQHRGRGLFTALAVAVASLSAAEAASAGTVAVNGQIQGAGRIVNVEAGPYNCDRSGNVNQAVVAHCPRETFGAWLSAYVKMRAVPRSSPAGHWRFVGWEGCQALTENGQVCEVNSGAFRLDERYPRAIFVDDRAPNIQIDQALLVGNRTARVDFRTDEGPGDGGRTECRLDSGGWTSCAGSVTYAGLSEGLHTVYVRGVDASGRTETESASVQVVDTAITQGPADEAFVSTRTSTFGFASGNATGYECSITQSASPAAWQTCSSPYTVTAGADGQWRLFVRARNGAFVDPDAARRTWNVDTVAPTTALDPTIGPGENAVQASTTERFAFTASEPVLRYECRLDGGSFEPCTSPRQITNLGVGRHTLSVRAKDRASNTGPAAVRNWRVAPRDDDGDGFGVPEDCNDRNPKINPGRPDIPDNGADENCDGTDAISPDRDGDGVPRPADCNDFNPAINPTRPDVPENGVDENCDGVDAPNLDRDKDGHPRPGDCDDGNAAIHPGARDRPGNGVDENCDGKDDALQSVAARLSWRAVSERGTTRLQKLELRGVPLGSTTRVSCKGDRKACRARVTETQRSGTVKLIPLVRKRLAAGAQIEIRVSHPERLGMIFRLRIGKRGPKLTTLCFVAGSRTPRVC